MTLQNLFQEKPTKRWNHRMIEDGDERFTEERIRMSEKVVVTFNEMNEAHDYFIETMEREELADFIDKAAKLAGLHIKEDEDITEEWREW
ncbi:sugar-specific transcriptional regulator TrmB [Paenibacillus sp. 4624]|uniref:hypothetical protein n=1 Tax=Paenibacillus sp. 4624 TaxID=3156453 RepID=UPI003D207145